MTQMVLRPLKINDGSVTAASKTLLMATHGWGKTYQIRNYYKRFGKGFVISGEAGLASVADLEVDYLPFTSFDRETNPDVGKYSFRAISSYVASDAFKSNGYKWIAIDSITELSQRCFEEVEKEFENDKNGFEKWAVYERRVTSALKWVRDLPYHVFLTSLLAEGEDASGEPSYSPILVQRKIQRLTPALFDHVFCGVRSTHIDDHGRTTVERMLITDEVKGYPGKSRDPYGRLAPEERCSDVTELLYRVMMTPDEYQNYMKGKN